MEYQGVCIAEGVMTLNFRKATVADVKELYDYLPIMN